MRNGWFGLPLFGARPDPMVVSCTLSGGGSRASFQIGALRYLYANDSAFTPSVFVGTSAGAILASGLAQYSQRSDQMDWVDRLAELWLNVKASEEMFTPRTWYRKLLEEGPAWLDMVQSSLSTKTSQQRALMPAFLQRRYPRSPASPDSPDPLTDPVEFALTPEDEVSAQWSLQHLSSMLSNVGRLPKIGSDMSAIWTGLEHTQSMYRPGPLLQRLLEPNFFDPARVRDSGMALRVALVALESGELRYMTELGQLVSRENHEYDNTQRDLVLGILASCSVPGVFRAVPIEDETYVDGGVRENLPAEMAIGLMGASVNYVLSSHVGRVPRRANMSDNALLSVLMRSTEILSDEANRDELEYAISAGATVIYPTVDVHDSMLAHPGSLRINADHGWLRAAEAHLELDSRQRNWHSKIIEQRVLCLQLEQRWLADQKSPETRRALHSAKERLRILLLNAHPKALPADADRWWNRFEHHPEPISEEPWWGC